MVVKGRGETQISKVSIGDSVLVAGGEFEPIYSFGHRNVEGSAEFLQIHTSNTFAHLEMSRDHMIHVEGKRWVPSSSIQVGDSVVVADGSLAIVTAVQTITRTGVFAPFTKSGTVVVNGIVASSFISFQDSEYLKIGDFVSPLSYQWLAHNFEAAHRLYCVLMACKGETYDDNGVSHFVNYPHSLARWMFRQNPVVIVVLLIPLLVLIVSVAFLESIVATFI